jgi:cell division initiation protein
MKITPLEIKQKTFTVKSFAKGFDREEVQNYLHILAIDWENLQDENKELRIRIDLLEKEVAKLKEVETSLYRTLKTAEDTSANIVEQARKTGDLKVQEAQNKADFILNDARLQAKGIVQKAQERARNTIDEMVQELKNKERVYQEIENYKDNMLVELRSFMNEALDKINLFSAKHPVNHIDTKIKESEDYLEERNQTLDEYTYDLEKEETSMMAVLNEPETPIENTELTENQEVLIHSNGTENNSFFDNLNP